MPKNNQKELLADTLPYCAELVQQYDPDRFLCSMFVRPDIREDVWTLLAFNHEIAKTRELVSESTLGHIRLQWWRDAIKGIYEGVSPLEHEVIKPLAQVIERHNLEREHFDKLIYAREFDLENVAPSNIEGVFHYTDFTGTPLLQLIISMMGDEGQAEQDLTSVAVNYGLCGILRMTAYHARQGRIMLPQDLCDLHNVNLDTIFEAGGQEALHRIIKDVIEARPRSVKTKNAYLRSSQALSQIYFKQIQALNFDVMSPLMQRTPPFKVLRMFCKTKGLFF